MLTIQDGRYVRISNPRFNKYLYTGTDKHDVMLFTLGKSANKHISYAIEPQSGKMPLVKRNGVYMPENIARKVIERAFKFCAENKFFPERLLKCFSVDESIKLLSRIK